MGISCKSTPKEIQNESLREEIVRGESVLDIVKESALLNVVIRKMGSEYPVSVSVVNGTETRWVQIDKPQKNVPDLLRQISEVTNMSLQEEKGYYF